MTNNTRLELLYCKSGFKNKFEKAWSKFLESQPTEQDGQAGKPSQNVAPQQAVAAANQRAREGPPTKPPIADATADHSAPAQPQAKPAEITQPAGQRKHNSKKYQ